MTQAGHIAIIGGGIGGLAAALALRQRGFDCSVYEQAPQLSEIGAGLNLSPNALKAFRMLGVEDEVITAGYQDEFQTTRNGQTGAIMAQQPRRAGVLEKYGASFLTVHRADVQNILRNRLPAEVLHLGKACTRVENTGSGARVTFADGSVIDAGIVIGADGIHSSVRDSLFGKQPPRFTGCICFRGLVPLDQVKHIPHATEMTGWWGPSGHVVQYRVRGGDLVNLVAHFDSDAWTEESWTRECSKEEILQTFKGWNDNLLQLIALGEKHYKWALYDRDPLDVWGRDSVTLLGDAVHPMLPYLGQGAAMALEDACILARALDANRDDAHAGLRLYEEVRRPRTTRVVLASRARAREYHLSSAFARMWRDLKMAIRIRFGTDKSTLRADWVYQYDAAQVALDPHAESAKHAGAIAQLRGT